MALAKSVDEQIRTIGIGEYEALPLKVQTVRDETKGTVSIALKLTSRHLTPNNAEMSALLKQTNAMLTQAYKEALEWTNKWNQNNQNETGEGSLFGKEED